jgi:ketosteroid isomerase-like protein
VLKAKVRGRVVELTGQETIVLRREKNGWKIAGGL